MPATRKWKGAIDGEGSTAGNWDTAPVAGDSVTFYGADLGAGTKFATWAAPPELYDVRADVAYGAGTVCVAGMVVTNILGTNSQGAAAVTGGTVATLVVNDGTVTGGTFVSLSLDDGVTVMTGGTVTGELNIGYPVSGVYATVRSDAPITLSGVTIFVGNDATISKGVAALTTNAATNVDCQLDLLAPPTLTMVGVTYLGTVASAQAWTLALEGSTLSQAVAAADLALRIGAGTSTFGGAVECRAIDLAGGTLDCNSKALTVPPGITGAGTLKNCPTTLFVSEGVIDGGGNMALIRRDGCATATSTGTGT